MLKKETFDILGLDLMFKRGKLQFFASLFFFKEEKTKLRDVFLTLSAIESKCDSTFKFAD